MQPHPNAQLIQYVITAAIIGLVLLLRARSIGRARRLRPMMLWVVPGIFVVGMGYFLSRFPPHGLQWAWLAVATAIGAALGWHRGKMMHISVDPATGTLNQQSSWVAFAFIIVLVAVRQGLKYEAGSLGFNVMYVTDLGMGFALGLITATRAEMFLRAQRLLAAA